MRGEVHLLARSGGKEFAQVLPAADLATHGIIAVRIGGAAVWPGPEGTAEQWLRSADEALCRAKRGGRHRVQG